MTSKGMTWDATADRKLFLGVLQKHDISIDYKAMAEYMSTDTQTCTVDSIKGRMKRLKAMAKEDGTVAAAGDDEATPKTKGRKRANASATGEETPTKKAKGGKANVAGKKGAVADDEDADNEQTPQAMVKKEEAEEGNES